jgi:(E)-4-hydroxy-3-methylbut-2-enyl-diphosphate synthase
MVLRPIVRKVTKPVQIRDQVMGGGHSILVQSMTTTDTRDIEATVRQIHKLESVGCELVRVAVLNMDAAVQLGEIKKRIRIPLVADIHFDHRLALEAIRQGVDKLRLNPGNITDRAKIEEVVRAAKSRAVPIRIGVNSGSLPKDLLVRHEGATPEAMVEAGLREIEILEENGFTDIVVSLKSTDVRVMIEAYRLMVKKINYPLHLGVTEAGLGDTGIARSALGIGTLLEEGIGDTLRCSLTGDPTREVRVAYDILAALHIRWKGIQYTACPTCGRIGINLEKIVTEVQKRLENLDKPIKVSMIGCVVNGPGEALHSNVGLVGAEKAGTIYVDGQPVKRVPEEQIVDEFVKVVLAYQERHPAASLKH